MRSQAADNLEAIAHDLAKRIRSEGAVDQILAVLPQTLLGIAGDMRDEIGAAARNPRVDNTLTFLILWRRILRRIRGNRFA